MKKIQRKSAQNIMLLPKKKKDISLVEVELETGRTHKSEHSFRT